MSQIINAVLPPKKRNHFISYIKGYAILSVLLIHMIDWSNIAVNQTASLFKELLYPGVFFFMATSGSVVYIAYAKSETWAKPAKKLFLRGLQLVGIYYLYNIIKFFIYDFSKEPFYWQFTNNGRMTLKNILELKAYTVPISILLTIGIMIMVSPVLLAISKKIKFPNLILSILLGVLLYSVYGQTWNGPIANFLFARNSIMFPIALWSIPFLIGYLLASFGFEEKKKWWLAIFVPIMAAFYFIRNKNGLDLFPSHSMYPLQPYYMIASLFFVSILFYLFTWSEKINFSLTKKKLSVVRFLGDYTLAVYIWHWIVVDITIWIFYPNTKLIWITVPAFLALYLFIKRAKLKEYFLNQV
ncbi:MAG: acyltransferase [Candidatus Magasanikbacteria bacterium]|nr:acyltransferase [Candidatus Magasanikbacteria bacterium]